MFHLYSTCLPKEEALGVWPESSAVEPHNVMRLLNLDEEPQFSEPQFLHLYSGDKNSMH